MGRMVLDMFDEYRGFSIWLELADFMIL